MTYAKYNYVYVYIYIYIYICTYLDSSLEFVTMTRKWKMKHEGENWNTMHCSSKYTSLYQTFMLPTIFHKSVQLIGYADDVNIMGRTKRAIWDVYDELKERAKEVRLIINFDSTKAMVQNRRLGKEGTLTAEAHKFEVVRDWNT